MDNFDRKIQSGLNSFKKNGGNIVKVKESLDESLDDLINIHQNKPTFLLPKETLTTILKIIILGGLIALVYFWVSQKNAPTPRQQFAKNFVPLEDIYTTRGSKDLSDHWSNGLKYYNTQNFVKARENLSQINSPLSKIYLANILLIEKKPNEAIKYLLDSNKMDKEKKYSDIIDWYLGLAYLQADDPQTAKTFFNKIINTPSHFKKKEAQKILQNLD